MNKVDKALQFQKDAHNAVNQLRKYTNEPYWNHPMEVMELVKSVGGDENQLCAALLHDTVEDTKVTLDQIKSEFGEDVASLVEMLTDVSKPTDGIRAVRKSMDLEHTRLASNRAKTIKLADLINNAKNIAEHDPKFAKVYFEEKRNLLKVLQGGNEDLYKQATDLVTNYFSI